MKINPYIQVQQVYNSTNSVSKTGKAVSAGRTDALEISSIGQDIQTAKSALAQIPDVRADITTPIKSAINNGTYSVPASSFAEKLTENYTSE